MVRKNKVRKSRGTEVIDQLNQLPDEILLSILSFLTLKEAARTSLISHRWKYLWRYHRILDFEDSAAIERIHNEKKSPDQERTDFISYVNHVMEGHLGPAIDELRVCFDFDDSDKSQIDKWVVSALEKHVKRIELDFEPVWFGKDTMYNRYTLPRRCCMPMDQPHNVVGVKHSLTSLCLKEVNVTTESIEWFLRSCPLLTELVIVRSHRLTSIQVSGLTLNLKYLEVSDCWNMEIIDISAPQLLSFVYFGDTIKLHIGSAPLLSKVSIGGRGRVCIAPVFDSLSKYFAQLECLILEYPYLAS